MKNITAKLEVLGALQKFKAEGSTMELEVVRGVKKVILSNSNTGRSLVVLNAKTYKEVEQFIDNAIRIYGGAI